MFSDSQCPGIGNVDTQVIEAVVRGIAREYELPNLPGWHQLKDQILSRCSLLEPARLEDQKDCAMRLYYQYRQEQVGESENLSRYAQTVYGHEQNRQRTPDRMPTPSYSYHSTPSETSSPPTSYHTMPLVRQSPHAIEQESTVEGSCMMSIYIDTKYRRGWEGAAYKRCVSESSYISTRILKRHKLEVDGHHIRLTWRREGHPKTFNTQFIVLPGLDCDFMLGGKDITEDSQSYENQEAYYPGYFPYSRGSPQAIPRSQNYSDEDKPNLNLVIHLETQYNRPRQLIYTSSS